MRSRFRPAVLLALILAQLLTVIALVLVSGRVTGTAEREHTDALLELDAANTAEHLTTHLAPIESTVDLTAALGISATDPMYTKAFLIAALERAPQLAGVFIGTPDGGFFDVRRVDDGYRSKTIEISDDGRSVWLQPLGENGSAAGVPVTDPTDTYDPRVRPWYGSALASPDEIIWTDPYVFFSSKQLGITAARVILDGDEVLGVVGADIELGALSEFLGTLDMSAIGGTVIVDRSGTVIAHPDPTKIRSTDADGSQKPVNVADLDDDFTRAAIAAVFGKGLANGEQATSFDSINGDSRVAIRTAAVGEQDWIVGVFASDDQLAPILSDARTEERWLTVAVGILTVMMAGFLAWPATKAIGALETQARVDTLTGLPNRRTILEMVEEETAETAVAMIDLDYFKSINDTWGHPVGDEVLVTVVSRIRSALRTDEATIGRIGGEEFLILFRDADPDGARIALERVRRRIGDEPVSTSVGPIRVTASVGLATFEDASTTSEVLTLADSALLEAKKSGRNTIVSRHSGEIATVGASAN